ncbi:MAG: hypothetical protein ACE5LC_04765 [Candidatus Aminicenantales bacterium]
MRENKENILSLLRIKPSPLSADFVKNKRQFQLHHLLTEQRHPSTSGLSFVIKYSIKEGLSGIYEVEKDVWRFLRRFIRYPSRLLQASDAVAGAIKEGRRIFIYGCGATGRLAKQMESAFWRPFWRKVKESGLWEKLSRSLPQDIEEMLIGEMTGGDRALISALEGFEDLELVGKLQLLERGIRRGDVVFCITEGGETSSVIGAMLAAVEQYEKLERMKRAEARRKLYFLYNNPDRVLKTFRRSQKVLSHPAITKINLSTGPQALAGSTRMQAVSVETFVMGVILERGIHTALSGLLSDKELERLGFKRKPEIEDMALDYEKLMLSLEDVVDSGAKFVDLESSAYLKKRHVTYFARRALITVFIDCAERSPTFHLHPLDTIDEEERKSWVRVLTDAPSQSRAWKNFLGRDFRGLDESFYRKEFGRKIRDEYLRETALKSLARAGKEQENLYDFSFSDENINRWPVEEGDLGAAVCVDDEIQELVRPESSFFKFVDFFKKRKAEVALILVNSRGKEEMRKILNALPLEKSRDVVIHCSPHWESDPLGMRKQVWLKVFLNAHSTAVMAWLGKVVGNTMTNVNPTNLKLIGRATHLILSHVNDVLSSEEWIKKYGKRKAVTYAEANAVLFDAMDFVSQKEVEKSEVELSIVRIIEALKRKRFVSWEEALLVSEATGLEFYIEKEKYGFFAG